MELLNAAIRIFGTGEFAASAARLVAEKLRSARSAVITGGGSARRIYEELAAFEGVPNLEIAFSDERAVPPDHEESNYRMARQTLLDPLGLTNIHRMRGEDEAERAAEAYEREIRDLVESGFDTALLGLGEDCHIAAVFPHSATVSEDSRLCVAVDRPDGMRGITLTPPALLAARDTIVVADGDEKAEAVRRALAGDERPEEAPVRLLAGAAQLTFVLDEAAARLLP